MFQAKLNNEQIIELPIQPWEYYEDVIKDLGETEETDASDEQLRFLASIGFCILPFKILTESGFNFFESRFIRSNEEESNDLLRKALLTFPPAEAMLQLLSKAKNPSRDNALSIMKSHGFWNYSSEAPLTNLLLLMNKLELISYSKKLRTIKVIFNPSTEEKTPLDMFIEPSKPYSNLMWVKKILRSCEGNIFWLDKHFTKEGLEILWEVSDPAKIQEIKIISLELDPQIMIGARKEYGRLKLEMQKNGIDLCWSIIDSKLIRDNHDRWIIEKEKAWNLPPFNAVLSGQRSEIHESPKHDELAIAFNEYQAKANELQ